MCVKQAVCRSTAPAPPRRFTTPRTFLPTALHALKRAGRVGAVGITGLPLPVFRKVLDAVPPGTVDVVRRAFFYSLARCNLDATKLNTLKYVAYSVVSAGVVVLPYDPV